MLSCEEDTASERFDRALALWEQKTGWKLALQTPEIIAAVTASLISSVELSFQTDILGKCCASVDRLEDAILNK